MILRETLVRLHLISLVELFRLRLLIGLLIISGRVLVVLLLFLVIVLSFLLIISNLLIILFFLLVLDTFYRLFFKIFLVQISDFGALLRRNTTRLTLFGAQTYTNT